MHKYNKMKTLFERDEHFKVTDKVSCKEFSNVNKWLVTEKVDGTNVRIVYTPFQNGMFAEPPTLSIKGKKDTSDMPSYLLHRLNEMFDLKKFMEIFPDVKEGVCLYGEGYGAKIRSGGKYNKGHNFRLFDVWLDGWWLEWEDVKNIADKLGIKTVPVIAETTLEEAVDFVKRKMYSWVALKEGQEFHIAEGIVARAHPMMLFRNGVPIKWKLKVKDYPPLDDNMIRLSAEEHRGRHGNLLDEDSERLRNNIIRRKEGSSNNEGGLITKPYKMVLEKDGGFMMKKDSEVYKNLVKRFN